MSMRGLLSLVRVPIAFALALCLSWGPWTQVSAAPPEARYARVGGDWYRVVESPTDAAAEATAVLEVAQRPVTRSRRALPALAGEEVDVLPPGADAPRSDWSALLSRTFVAEPDRTRVTYTVGDDSLSIAAVAAAAPLGTPAYALPSAIEVDVNGTTALLEVEALRRFAAAPQDEPQLEHELAELGRAFGDPRRFLDAHTRLHLVTNAVSPPAVLRSPTGIGDCTRPCIACAGSVLSLTATWLTVSAACTATVATAGIAAPACIAAVIGHEVVALALLSACGECAVCLDQKREEEDECCKCTGEPLCDCKLLPPCPPE